MPYIYKITNHINGKVYIGKTSLSIQERFEEHKRDSIRGRMEKRPLYDAFSKYGIDNFEIEEIEQVENDEIASDREQYWIKEYNSYIGSPNSNGYNATLGGDGTRTYNYKELAKAYLELGTSKAVCEKYHCDSQTVRLACLENGIEIKIAPNQKTIIRIDENQNQKEYVSITDAARDIVDKRAETARHNISRALNKSNTHIAYGYKWFYKGG